MNLKQWRWIGLALFLLSLAPVGAGRAQTTMPPNVLAYFRIHDIKPYSFLAVFAPGESTPVMFPSGSTPGSYDVSPDGQWVLNIDTISLRPVYVAGPGIQGLFDDVRTNWIRTAQFTVDGRYLLYKGFVLSKPERDAQGYYQIMQDRLLVGILDLSTRQRFEILLQPGSFGDDDHRSLQEQAATYWYSFEYFHFDGQSLWVHRPDSLDFYAFDLSGMRFTDQPIAVPAPPAQLFFEELAAPPPTPMLPPTAIPTPDLSTLPRTETAPFSLFQDVDFQVSPDGTQLALWRTTTYAVNEAATNERFSTVTLFLYDLASRRTLLNQDLDWGNTIQSLTWKPDGSEVLFILTGADPLYSLNLDTQTITAGPSLNQDGGIQVQEILACDHTLFFVGLSVPCYPALYSAPLDDWTARSGPLDDLDLSPRGSVDSIHLMKCLDQVAPNGGS
jgi:hypothetical protein